MTTHTYRYATKGTITTLKKLIKESKPGDVFYMNAINASINSIEYLQEMIRKGKVRPLQCELDKMIVPEFQYKFLNGDSICPQMDYEIMEG